MPKQTKAAPTPYEQLFRALCDNGAQCLNQMEHKGPNPFTLEFWAVPTNKESPLVIVQHWTGDKGRGSWDAYTSVRAHKTAEAIAETLGTFLPDLPHAPHGPGDCPVCGHTGDDCTGKAQS